MTSRCRRFLASVSVAALCTAALAPAAAGVAPFGGRVVGLDGVTPFVGAVVNLVGSDGVAVARSSPTGSDGAFAIETAPEGTYRLLVETKDGAYLAPDPVSLGPAPHAQVSLTLLAQGPSYQLEQGIGGGQLTTWAKYAIIGGIGVAGIFAINEVSEDEEEDASPF